MYAPKIQVKGLREHCKLRQRGLGPSPSRQTNWCILALKSDMCNHFPDKQLTKFCAVYYITTFQQDKATAIYSFTECMIYSYPRGNFKV